MDKKYEVKAGIGQSGSVISVRAPDAKEVCVAGAFNDWNPKSHVMKAAQGGEWTRTLDLAPGRHEYKFVIDGQWCCEPGGDEPCHDRPGCVANQHGTMNRMIEIKDASEPTVRVDSSTMIHANA